MLNYKLNNQKAELLTRAESSTGQCVRKIETLPVILKFTPIVTPKAYSYKIHMRCTETI